MASSGWPSGTFRTSYSCCPYEPNPNNGQTVQSDLHLTTFVAAHMFSPAPVQHESLHRILMGVFCVVSRHFLLLVFCVAHEMCFSPLLVTVLVFFLMRCARDENLLDFFLLFIRWHGMRNEKKLI
jgi:hypothetical protein